jgi:hypothetical protein
MALADAKAWHDVLSKTMVVEDGEFQKNENG